MRRHSRLLDIATHDAVAASILSFGMNTEIANGVKGKGNFKVQNMDFGPQS